MANLTSSVITTGLSKFSWSTFKPIMLNKQCVYVHVCVCYGNASAGHPRLSFIQKNITSVQTCSMASSLRRKEAIFVKDFSSPQMREGLSLVKMLAL